MKLSSAQEFCQTDEARKDELDSGVHDYNVQEQRVEKRCGHCDAALQAHQVREGRKPVDKGKYQRLERLKSSSYDMNRVERMSADGAGEESNTSLSRQNL